VQRVTILYDASQAVLSTFDLDEVLRHILAIVRDYFNLENGSILLVDDMDDTLYVRTHFGSRDDVSDVRIPIGRGISGRAAAEKRPLYIPDVSLEPNYICGTRSTRSELAIPLMVQEMVVGVLDLQSDHLDHFDKETIDLLTLFAAQASLGIQNAKLYSLVQRRAAQLEAINALAKQTTVELDIKDLLDRFCNQLPKSFPVDSVAVFLRDEERQLTLQACNKALGADLDSDQLQERLKACPMVLDAIESVVSHAIECETPCIRNAHAEVCLPLVSFGSNIGILVCASHTHSRFGINDIQALESVADILATALQNSIYVEKVRQLASRDGLTGMFNRRAFEERLSSELTRSERYGGNFAILMIDIDHFKAVNDEFGHLLGDEVLKHAATIFSHQLRKVDPICRFGGEEFAIILPATNLESAAGVAEKLRRAFHAHEFSGIPRPVTISIGVASYPEHGTSRDALVRAADKALYQAKQDGRNRVATAELPTTA
jgi:two-component system, cell cycle response regulator